MMTPTFLQFLNEQSDDWQVLDEAGLSRVLAHIATRNLGIITAFRGGSGTPLEQNRAKNRQLKNDIRQAGFGFIRLQGSWPENEGTPEEVQVIEESFLVIGREGDDHGALKGFLKKAGAKYQQDAIVYKPWNTPNASLIYMSNPQTLQSIGTFSLNPANIDKMYSKFKGHKFVFHQMSEQRGFMSRLAHHRGYK